MFQFKQFSVNHTQSSMKVGTDAVLLASWADVSGVKSILDIGCGSGIISLVLAQRTNAIITAIDIDEASIKESSFNFENSPWGSRLWAGQISLQDFSDKANCQFDLIISNPPFFNNSLKSPIETKNKTRHTEQLSFQELVSCAAKLLNSTGRFCCVLPFSEKFYFTELALSENLYCIRYENIYTKANKSPKRCLMEFSKQYNETKESDLIIRNNENKYTDEYLLLVKNFYLHL